MRALLLRALDSLIDALLSLHHRLSPVPEGIAFDPLAFAEAMRDLNDTDVLGGLKTTGPVTLIGYWNPGEHVPLSEIMMKTTPLKDGESLQATVGYSDHAEQASNRAVARWGRAEFDGVPLTTEQLCAPSNFHPTPEQTMKARLAHDTLPCYSDFGRICAETTKRFEDEHSNPFKALMNWQRSDVAPSNFHPNFDAMFDDEPNGQQEIFAPTRPKDSDFESPSERPYRELEDAEDFIPIPERG